MSNVLTDDKQQQILALGRHGWPLRRIEQATTVRRQTVSRYLKVEALIRKRGGTIASNAVVFPVERT